MIYIAISNKLARVDLSRALRFRIEAPTITDMCFKLARVCEKENCKWYDYTIFSVD